ncbi:hypothetical protein [Nocardioides jiangxiensis]|uniref:Uncharacterized protein n=1 Tax=Nocardioides jiangxiensis TaxID=3064524 RepID=A0ABT9B0H3_9ACTN|nr:hypothetical protein [Nocardioides sp. WY-20]MDO7868178.1 hypothetical protein [Nocardioides sp. WY-20]
MRRGMISADQRIELDRGLKGGIRIPAHCEACRSATSPWDDEYIRWAKFWAEGLIRIQGQGANGISATIPNARPGRFIRAALSGMSALAERLVETHPAFIAAVLRGEGQPQSNNLRFLMALTPVQEKVSVGGIHQGWQVHFSTDGSEVAAPVSAPSAVIHHAPLSLLLVDESTARLYPHVDCTHWLAENAVAVRNDVNLTLPVVRLVSENRWQPESFEVVSI